MGTNSPLVSVVLPTYNRASVLPKSIESVLEQTYTNFELIVVDDGSTDETAEIISNIVDTRVSCIRHDTNKGAQAARNTGIEASSGAFIAFQDSDDRWEGTKLQKQMDVFNKEDASVGVVYTQILRIQNDKRRYIPNREVNPKEGSLLEALLRFNFISLQTAVVRKQCFEEVGGFDERIPRLQDWELWLRIASHYEFRIVNEPLVTAVVSPDSISQDVTRMAKAREIILKKHRDKFGSKDLAYHQFRTGHSLMKAGYSRKGRSYLWKSARENPRLLYIGLVLLSSLGSRAYRHGISLKKFLIQT